MKTGGKVNRRGGGNVGLSGGAPSFEKKEKEKRREVSLKGQRGGFLRGGGEKKGE